MRSVVAGGPGFITVGTLAGQDWNPAAWVSVDGLTWDSVPVERNSDSPFVSMNSVTAGGPGFVAVGMDTFADFPKPSAAAVWISVDGMSWQRVSHPALTESAEQEMWGITRSPSHLIAVGFSGEAKHEFDAAVWISSDGKQWERASRDTLTTPSSVWIPDDNEPTAAHGPNGYVAIGNYATDGRQALWHSTDGHSWNQIPDSSLPQSTSVALVAITATDNRYAAVGTRHEPNGDADVMVWLSDDGLTWNQIAFDMDGQQVAGATTTFGDEIVVVGLDADEQTYIVWHSTNGEDWETLTPPTFDNAGGIPMVAYTHNNQIIILGYEARPIIGRP